VCVCLVLLYNSSRLFSVVFRYLDFQITTRCLSSALFLSFSGFMPRLIKVAPACAIMISTYEFGKAFFRRYNQQKHGMTQLQPSAWSHTANLWIRTTLDHRPDKLTPDYCTFFLACISTCCLSKAGVSRPAYGGPLPIRVLQIL